MPARWHCSASRCLNGCKRIIYRLLYKTRGCQTKLSGSLFEAFVYYSYSALLPVRVAGNLYKSGCKHRDKIVETGEAKQPSTLKTIKPKLMDVFLYNLLRMSKKSTIFAAAFLGMKTARVHIAVFASGEGTTLQALLDSQESSHYQVTLVVSNKECGALLRASRVGVPSS